MNPFKRFFRPEVKPFPSRFYQLGTYNAECGRGIVHTAEHDQHMARIQAEYNEWVTKPERHWSEIGRVVGSGPWPYTIEPW